MPVAGKVYIVPIPEERSWQLVVHNTGDRAFGVTQNILPANNPNMTAHDDHVLYGHGLGVNAGAVSWQKFVAGDQYNHQGNNVSHTVDESCFLRVGLRGLAQMTVKLPAMDEGPVELDLADFQWYGGNAASSTPQLNDWAGSRPRSANAADGPAIIQRVHELIARGQTNGVKCEGAASLTAVRGEDGALSHWEVRFENHAEQAFIGTCAFVGAQKNDGLGLEAMGVPNSGSAAMQRIEAYGNYGVEAAPGAKLRLGVRGYAWIEVALPKDGKVDLPLEKFKIDARQMSPEYFDKDAVTHKRDEKVAKVQFFENGAAINNELKPTMWKGDAARQKSTFDAPRLLVKAVPDGKDTPGGGFLVEVESRLAEFVEDERAGFVAAVRLAGSDMDSPAAKQLKPKKLEYPGAKAVWFIQKGADCGGVAANDGVEVQVATKGLGWSASVPLPSKGVVDSDKDDALWGLREDQESKRLLRQSYIQRVR
ncbi:MAG TPA: hypothetical protein VGO62_05455 [Myxococcota bacterium]|jgi:hypothetical protein